MKWSSLKKTVNKLKPKKFYEIDTLACIIKLITAVIYGFRNKLKCFSLNTRLGWKGLPGANTLAHYGNHKLQP